jgi:hypothetical protein
MCREKKNIGQKKDAGLTLERKNIALKFTLSTTWRHGQISEIARVKGGRKKAEHMGVVTAFRHE